MKCDRKRERRNNIPAVHLKLLQLAEHSTREDILLRAVRLNEGEDHGVKTRIVVVWMCLSEAVVKVEFRGISVFAGKLSVTAAKFWPSPDGKRTSPINRTRNSTS